MATIERESRFTEESPQPEGEFAPDKGEAEQADRIAEKLEQPLPEDLVMDVDNYVGKRMQEQDSVNTLLGREVAEMLSSNTEDSYIELVKDLQGYERREAKSLNDVARELPQLGEKERANKLQALKVFSLALNEMQPTHETAEEWQKLSEEERDMVWVAEITKRRMEIIAAEEIYMSDEVADKEKVRYALELGDGLRAYGKEDDLPADIKEEFELAANRANLFLKNHLKTKMEKKVPGKRPSVAEGNGRGGVAEAGAVDEVKGAEEVAEETLVPSVGETIVPAETVLKTPDQVETEQVLAKDKIEQAREKAEMETVKQRIFGREAIKKEDVKAIDKQLRELAEKGDTESAFELARELSHLRRAGIKLSGRGQEYYKDKLGAQVVAVRERGARAVAQFHAYLKYLGMEDGLADEDREIIRDGCEMGGLGNRRQLAALAMNAKYLGVLEDVNVIKDDLQADFSGQLEDAVDIDTIALEMARRKYLKVQYELPDKYADQQKLINSRLAGYGKDERWDEYVRLKTQVDYVRGSEAMDEKKQEKLLGHVEKMAEHARENGAWSEYSVFIGDVAHLSRHNGKNEQANKTKANQMEAESIIVGSWIDQDSEAVQRETEGVEPKKEDGTSDTSATDKTEQDDAGNKKDVDPEQYPHRAQFEDKAKKFNEAQEHNPEAWGSGKDIFHRERLELKWRENYLLKRRQEQERESSVEAQWANEAMDRLREGSDLSEVINEDYLMEHLLKHKVSAPEREERRGRYLGIMRNELGLAQMIDKPTVMDRVTSLWMEKWYARVNVAKGLDKVKAFVPWGKKKRQEVIRARQDTVNTMLEAAEDNEVDSKVRALLQRMATEFEIMNVREARKMLKYQRSKKKGKKKTTRQTVPAQGNEQNKAGE